MKKTKFLVSGDDQEVLQKSGKYPCPAYCSGVGRNSTLCSQCMLWVHKTCSGITKRLVEDPNHICSQCRGDSQPINGQSVTEVDVDIEATFCYLGDMLCSGGGCDSAIAARCCVAWGKFRKLLPVLTSSRLSPKIRGKVYVACIRLAMLHGSETWGPKEHALWQLHRNDCAMIHWICGIKDQDETPSASLQQKLDIEDITLVLRCQQLRWYGHVQRTTSCIKSVPNFNIPGTRKKGRPWKTWSECAKTDVNMCGLAGVDPLDRDAWRISVWHSLVLPIPLNGTRTTPQSKMDTAGWTWFD